MHESAPPHRDHLASALTPEFVREVIPAPPRERERSELAELLDRADPSDFDRIVELLEAEARTDAAN
jgi:hypothetical protein